MSILRLKNVGDEATLEITRCEVVEGQYGEQVMFEAGDETLYLPKASADRQFDRIGVDVESAVGQTLHFSRTASNKPGGQPFWNINTVKPKANGKPPVSHSQASKPDSQLPPLLRNQQEEDAAELASKVGIDLTAIEKQLSIYLGITEWYLDKVVPILTKSDIGCTPESVAAGIATVFINSTGGKK